jgi:RND family efflux transporter MFP subunit
MNINLNKSSGIFLLTAGVCLFGCSIDNEKEIEKADSIIVQVETPRQRSEERISVSGQVESQETAIIGTRVMGFISSIKVRPGDHVQKGQLLISVNNGDIIAKRAQAEAMIAEADATLKDAQKDYERFQELFKQESASAKEFENATLRYNSVNAKAEAARQMKNEADAMLAYTNIVAPFSGVITQKYVDEGSLANPGMPLLALELPKTSVIRAFVSENEVGKLKMGMSADVTIKSTRKQFIGKISEISPSSHFTGGQFQIKIAVPINENAELFSGMYVDVSIVIQNDNAISGLFVPASAIIHKDQLSGVYTVSNFDQTAQLRWLRLGKKYGNAIEVLSGLTLDEKFITKSEGRLYSGVPVIIK